MLASHTSESDASRAAYSCLYTCNFVPLEQYEKIRCNSVCLAVAAPQHDLHRPWAAGTEGHYLETLSTATT